MKKVLILLFLFFLMAPSFALNYDYYCSPDTASKSFSGVISSVSGVSLLTRQIIEKEIENYLKKETDSKFKVKVNSFWGANIAKGEFSRFYAISKNFSNKNFHSQKLTLETVCPYNKVSYEDNNLNFDTNMVLKFDSELNEENLSQLFKQKLQIEDNKIALKVRVSAFGVKTTLKLYAGLEVVDNKIQLCHITFNDKSIKVSKYAPLLNNLINFSIDLNKNTKAKIKIDSVKIKNSLVYISGYTLIPKN